MHLLIQRAGQVVAQIIEAEFVIGAVRHIAGVNLFTQKWRLLVLNGANRDAKKAQRGRIPGGVARRKIIVHGNDVHAAPTESVEVARQRSH